MPPIASADRRTGVFFGEDKRPIFHLFWLFSSVAKEYGVSISYMELNKWLRIHMRSLNRRYFSVGKTIIRYARKYPASLGRFSYLAQNSQ